MRKYRHREVQKLSQSIQIHIALTPGMGRSSVLSFSVPGARRWVYGHLNEDPRPEEHVLFFKTWSIHTVGNSGNTDCSWPDLGLKSRWKLANQVTRSRAPLHNPMATSVPKGVPGKASREDCLGIIKIPAPIGCQGKHALSRAFSGVRLSPSSW